MKKSLNIPTIITSKEFTKIIDDIIKKEHLTIIEAVTHFCEKYGVEVETAASLIKSSSKLKKRVQREAEQHNLLKRA